MAAIVKIINEPYEKNVQILIDGKAISVYSCLEKYMNQPFYEWCDLILIDLYKELNEEDYVLYFQSRQEEIEIMEQIVKKYSFCKQYIAIPLEKNIPLQKRMADLSSLIKYEGIKSYSVQRKNAFFFINPKDEGVRSEIQQIVIKNIYCEILVQVLDYENFKSYNSRVEDILFFVCDVSRYEECKRRHSKYKGFLIVLDETVKKTEFMEKTGCLFCYHSNKRNLIDAVFLCCLLVPLLQMFINGVDSLGLDIKSKYSSKIKDITSTRYRVIPIVEKNVVDVGKNLHIEFKLEGQKLIDIKDLYFKYEPKGILECNGFYIEGKKEGEAKIYIYRKGEFQASAVLEMKVERHNRVQSIRLEEHELILGVGDNQTLKYDYFPVDADNLKEIEWKTDNANIARFDKNGVLYARNAGNCMGYILVGQVSDKCSIKVRPYLQQIITEKDAYELHINDTIRINTELYPENCLDGQLVYALLDMRVASVQNGLVIAHAIGETTLLVQNKTETVKKEIKIVVLPPIEQVAEEKRKQKKGFFSKLFR